MKKSDSKMGTEREKVKCVSKSIGYTKPKKKYDFLLPLIDGLLKMLTHLLHIPADWQMHGFCKCLQVSLLPKGLGDWELEILIFLVDVYIHTSS